jgi:uncharacterized membrane protein YjjP (DUF1212 family)
MTTRQDPSLSRVLYLALSIGEGLLISGAEISRVEDTICRICKAYGAEEIDVFAITSSIVVSICKGQEVVTQTRRIHDTEYNLHRLEQWNQLSRSICENTGDPAQYRATLDAIRQEPGASFFKSVFFYALVSSSFSVFFGGSGRDALASAAIGMLIRCLQLGFSNLKINHFIGTFLCSIAGGLFSILAVRYGIGQSSEMISIGNIMLLIPGIAMTNGIRDMFSENTISGLLRLVEALLLAIVIALAFVLTSSLL